MVKHNGPLAIRISEDFFPNYCKKISTKIPTVPLELTDSDITRYC